MSASNIGARDNPGVIAPPPLIFAGILAIGILIDRYFTGVSTHVPGLPRCAFATIMISFAAVFLGGALGLFRKARTRAEPWQPTTAIVTDGIYRYTRNPMYVGMALAYAGLAATVDSPIAFILLPAALLVIQHGVVLREEKYLQEKFGAEYLRYKSAVRRWF
jgi:protein-S-isoprenylcysteine O-methyltransferase Ste14